MELSDGTVLDYEYDACGRITKVTETRNGTATVTEYTYDALGQLLTEKVNGTVVNAMTYDSYGNILTKNGVAYGYDAAWKDRLVSVGNKAITYGTDPCNPSTYFGNSLVWENGRQLKQFGNYTYKYNANGIRTRKTVNNINHFYFLDGTKILREKWGEDDIVPIYDTNESVIGLTHSTESGTNTYYFLKNLQGDIIAITDASGTVIARYKYDAWGKVLSVTDANGNSITSPFDIANVNPFRYRGYYYDTETGLYYLQSRYYDPSVGRFINVDDTETISLGSIGIEYNLFIYCSNSPVNDEDDCGALSFNTIKKVISDFINSVFKAAVEELKNVFIITKKSLEVKSSVIAAAIDGLIMLISATVAFLTKSAIKIVVRNFLLKKTNASQKFIRFLIDLLLKPGIVGAVVALIGFIFRWTKYKINAFTSDVIQNLLNAKTKLLRNVYAIYTAISSVGSFIAFCLDLFDGDPNGYLKIKFA